MDFDLQPLPRAFSGGGDPDQRVRCVLCQRTAHGRWSALAHAGWHWCTTSLDRTVFVCEPCTTTRRRRARTTPPPSPSSVRRPPARAHDQRHPALEPKHPAARKRRRWPLLVLAALLAAAALWVALGGPGR
jgi:hypothetical protein